MKPTESAAFSHMMALVAELYGKACTEPFVNIYWHLLKDFELLAIRKALMAHLRNPDGGQFFPKPADILLYLEGTGQSRALQAWSQVEAAIGQVGAYQSLVFDDALIHAVIEAMGGWIKLCEITLKELSFYRLEFKQRYQAFCSKAPERHPPYLCGLIERENAKEGYAFPAPILVGDVEKAKSVMRTGVARPLLVHRPQSMEALIRGITKAQQDTQGDKHDES